MSIDHLSLDQRKFNPSRDDIEAICCFFAIGKLKNFEKEKGISISHANFFVYAQTTKGRYALKFYPPDTARSIAVEYAANRIFIKHHFKTPLMHAGINGQAFLPSNKRLASCFNYIDGLPAWQSIKEQNTYSKINTALLSLKNILTTIKKTIPFPQQINFVMSTNILAQDSRSLASYDQKAMIDACLLDACRSYQQDQKLFTGQLIHNNANLTNFLVCQKKIYTLDLSHIREDYILSDLASMLISCLFFDTPLSTIKAIAKNYMTQHKLTQDHYPVLNTLVKVGLIKEYLKNVKREDPAGLSAYPSGLVRSFRSQLSKRKKLIATILKKKKEIFL